MLMMALAVMNAGLSFLNAPLAAHLGAEVSAVVVHFSIFVVVGGAVPPPEDPAGYVECAPGDRNRTAGLQPMDELPRG